MSESDAENVVTQAITVELAQERTFRLWTEQIRAWWPAGHSLSGDPRTQVFIEGKVGGRFYERTSDGTEQEWGRVELWEPPTRLVFTWYLGSGPALPTRVEVTFVSLAPTQTRVEIEHRGPELVGALWWARKNIFRASWEMILAQFARFLAVS